MVSFHLRSTLGGKESCSHYADKDTKAQRGSFTCWGPERACPAFVHKHHRLGRMRDPLPSCGRASSQLMPSSYHARSDHQGGLLPGWLGSCRGVPGGCFYPQSSGSIGPACGPALWPPEGLLIWSSEARLSQSDWPGTFLCPTATSSPRRHQHLSRVGF